MIANRVRETEQSKATRKRLGQNPQDVLLLLVNVSDPGAEGSDFRTEAGTLQYIEPARLSRVREFMLLVSRSFFVCASSHTQNPPAHNQKGHSTYRWF